jgi:hypothetical protein
VSSHGRSEDLVEGPETERVIGTIAMTRAVFTFALSDLATGAVRFALICPEARYASIASPGGVRLERRFVTP